MTFQVACKCWSCEEVNNQTGFTPVDLIVLTDKATGRIGKLAAIQLLSRGGEIPVLHLDDSIEVVSEFAGHRNITPIHIAVPGRGRTEYPAVPVSRALRVRISFASC